MPKRKTISTNSSTINRWLKAMILLMILGMMSVPAYTQIKTSLTLSERQKQAKETARSLNKKYRELRKTKKKEPQRKYKSYQGFHRQFVG